MRTILAIDFDANAAATYRCNFPDTIVEWGKVASFIPSIPSSDLIIGGPPCQSHSLAGKRLASSDERDGGAEFIAAVNKVKSRHFLMENVGGLLSSEGGKYWQWLYGALVAAGYVIQYRVLDAVAYGVPQFRERLWVWGIRRDVYESGVRHSWPFPTHSWPWPQPCMFGAELERAVTVGMALNIPHRQCDGTWFEGNGNHQEISLQGHGGFDGGKFDAGTPSPTLRNCLPGCGDMKIKVIDPKHPFQQKQQPANTITSIGSELSVDGRTWEEMHPIADGSEPAPTIKARSPRDGGRCVEQVVRDRGSVRRLTVEECMRLMSAADDFKWPAKISKTAKYKICGNGQAPLQVWRLRQCIERADPKIQTVIDLFCGGGLGASGWHGRFWSFGK